MTSIDIHLAAHQPRLDDRPLRKRIGLVILATDHTTEVDFQRMVAGERIGIYVSRIPYANPTTPENLMKMQPVLTEGASLILPDETLDAVMYSCTSASVVIGDERIEQAIRAAKPGVPVVTPTAAAVKGLKAVGAKRISILTPYTVETSRPMADYFARLGFTIDRFTCLGFEDDREMARIAPDEIVSLARKAMAPQSDALFISCTAVRAAQVAARVEAEIGRPMISSNLATAWACLQLCGETASRPELGTLMTRPYPEG
ncbi:ectoine utilization protein EutA [Rhizobium sp. LCM 4573]|uniref:ectoine utilization protein EutA n=1 Tax=Rhizobium sp. LCM 4573 TaxID=1848291 RepID=UPI0008D905A3|nr:ectoine utilization protein EutA [Rhizobium sp. LCM 4573]OHV77031.1 ectoine utilization protein EutA [Rhizobium sp. LCM 4573]